MLSIFQHSPSRNLVMPWVTGLVWALAAASIVFWVLMWPTQQTAMALAPTAADQTTQATQAQTAKALGDAADPKTHAVQPASSQFKLMGVIASPTGQGSALIATDGQAPKAYRAGQTVQDGWTLVSLTPRQARLKSATAQVTLDLPVSDKP
jgi:general secretion pathway protein C